jgi:TP901 family phage tail tape measure protein
LANGMNISFTISAVDDFSGVMSNLQSQTEKAFDSIGAIGKAMTLAGVALGGALGFAAKSAMDFEQQMSNVKAVSGATATEMTQLTQLAQELGASTKYSSLEAAQGIEELIKAGVSVADIMGGGLEGALSLATAGELELADAAEIASTALNAFKSDGLTVINAADLLAGAANASATSVGELKYGLSMVSAVAAGVGLSFQDTTTALAAFANNGLKGSDAGTSLKTMLLNLSPATEGASTAMQELGLLTEEGNSKFYDANGSIRSLGEIAELLKTQLAGLTDEQRQLAMKTMFGTDAIRAANILYKEGADGINKMYGEMSKVTSAEVAAEKMNNVKGRIEELKGAIETMSIAIGNALLPVIDKLVAGMQWLVDKFNALPGYMQTTLAVLAALTAAFLLIVGPILIMVAMIPAITAGFTAIAGAVGVTAGALAGIIGIVLGVVAALVAIGIGLVVAYNKVEWFRDMVDAAWAWIKDVWNTALEFISGIVKSVMSAVASFIGDRLNDIKSWWSENGQAIMELAKSAWSVIKGIIQTYLGYISMVFQTVFPIIVGVVKVAWAVIQAVFSTVINVILGFIGFWAKIFTGDVKGAMNTVKNTFSTIWNNIVSIFKGINLAEIGRNIVQGLVNGIKSMASAVGNAVSGIAKAIPAKIKSFLGIHSPSRVLMELGEFTGEGFVKGIGSMIRDVSGISAEMASAAVPSIATQSTYKPSTETNRQNISPINLTLNYNGTGAREDAVEMLNVIERGLSDRLGLKLRLNGVR